MGWYCIFPEEKARHGYSPKCKFDGKVLSPTAYAIAQELADNENRPMQIFRGKHAGSLWTTVYPKHWNRIPTKHKKKQIGGVR